MVNGFNKWFLLAAIPLIFTGKLPVSAWPGGTTSTSLPHPLHLSVTEIEQNATEKTVEITCKLFTDDFENILERTYKTNVDLINPPDRPAIQKLVNDYIQKNLIVKIDGKAISFSCIGFERDHEATFCYLEASNITVPRKVEMVNTLMYDLFDDQTNIIHVTVGGKRKSTKLNYPSKDALLGF